MDSQKCAEGAKATVDFLTGQGFSGRELSSVLGEARRLVVRPHLTDDEIKGAMLPGRAFRAKQLAASLGCSAIRVTKIATAAGFEKVAPGVYQVPA